MNVAFKKITFKKITFKKIVTSCFLVLPLLIGGTIASADTHRYDQRPEVQTFIAKMVRQDFSETDLVRLFQQVKYQQPIIDAISRPAERTLNWSTYQDIFLTLSRLEGGRRFMLENEQALQRAEAVYGVPTEIITAIIGVETMYGRIRGKYRVIDSLSTLAFDYPPRSAFFKSELEQFLLLAREENQNPELPLGSYAGAMGYGQFISSSYRHYAVDFDGDGKRDIWENKTDAIGSVANYFSEHGWRQGQVIAKQVSTPSESGTDLFGVDLMPSKTLLELIELGINAPTKDLPLETKVSPIVLTGKQGQEYWLGFHNFYVITRYNHSHLYAMVVYQLSQQLRTASDEGAL